MTKPAQYYLTLVLLLIISSGISPAFIQATSIYSTVLQQDPPDKQVLLNGRIWRNQYSRAVDDQYFLTNTFLKGSVTFNGKKYNNLDLKYDIANDELMLSIESYPVILMNKEMVDSFSLVFDNRSYHIINAGFDTSNVLRGYVNVLYDGPSTLYVKYIKRLQKLAVDGRYDALVPEHQIYLRKGTELVAVKGKRMLLKLLEDKKYGLRQYMKSNRFKFRRKDPNTFVPLLEYYDRIRI